MRAPLSATSLLLLVAVETTAWGAEDDGVYGRFDGDVGLEVAAGVAVTDGPSLAVGAAAVYLSMIGPYVRYLEGFEQDDLDVSRSIAAGMVIRPLFLGRYANDLERGPARLDLWLDSFGLFLGAVWMQAQGDDLGSRPGAELGVSTALPILETANGPFVELSGGLRLADRSLEGRHADGYVEPSAVVTLGLSWRQMVALHLVDAGDRARR